MKKLSVFLSTVFTLFIGVSFAYSSLNPSYSINGEDVTIYRADNWNWWYMDINLKDPSTNDWLHFGEVKVSDEAFTYTKQWAWDQEFQIVLWDWSTPKQYLISSEKGLIEVFDNWTSATTNESKDTTRTVIPAVPKTGPSGSLIWIILATLVIFGGYIYIKKRADI